MYRRLGILLLVSTVFLGAASAWAADPLSPRLRRVQTAFQNALAKPGLDPMAAIPGYSRTAIHGAGGLGKPGTPAPSVTLLAVAQDPAVLDAFGFTPNTIAGTVATLTVPISRLDELAAVPGLIHAEIARPLRSSLDISAPDVKSDLVNGRSVGTGPPYGGYTGAGIVVGVIDSGIDLSHDDFRNPDGSTRIIGLWDQWDSVGPAPSGFPGCNSVDPSHCGTAWTPAQINANQTRQRDEIGHGTHVAGIAAGDGSAAPSDALRFQFVGVAPEADLAIVNTTFLDAALIDGIAWIHQVAGSKPSVVNMSLGAQYGPHDGTDPLDVALENLGGEGRILVAASGNEGADPIHAETTLPAGEKRTFNLSIPNYAPCSGGGDDYAVLEAWYSGPASRVTVVAPNGARMGPYGRGTNMARTTTTQGTVDVSHNLSPMNGDSYVYVDIWDAVSAAPAPGTWKIEFEQVATEGNDVEIDFWIPWSQFGGTCAGFAGNTAQWTNYLDQGELVSTPASSHGVIAVGAYTTKACWDGIDPKDDMPARYCWDPAPILQHLANFSSTGPNRDGYIKPDLTAPGFGVASAISAFGIGAFRQSELTTPDRQHVVASGTSMATPHVAGAVALLLERDPGLTPQEALEHLTQSARSDQITGTVPNARFGHGRLDVEDAMDLTPVRLLGMNIAWVNGIATLRWELTETEPGTQFTIERSAQPRGGFQVLDTVSGDGLLWSWTDPAPRSDEPWYRVSTRTRNGELDRFGPVQLDPLAGPVRLWQNAPNPFAANTRIRFELPAASPVRVVVVDANGRLVATLHDGELGPGSHDLVWDGSSDGGTNAAAGVYFYRLTTEASVQVRRMLLVR